LQLSIGAVGYRPTRTAQTASSDPKGRLLLDGWNPFEQFVGRCQLQKSECILDHFHVVLRSRIEFNLQIAWVSARHLFPREFNAFRPPASRTSDVTLCLSLSIRHLLFATSTSGSRLLSFVCPSSLLERSWVLFLLGRRHPHIRMLLTDSPSPAVFLYGDGRKSE
jgi:hypothetical protein